MTEANEAAGAPGGSPSGSTPGKLIALIPVVALVVCMVLLAVHYTTRQAIPLHTPGTAPGDKLYDLYCARCHQPDLKGRAPQFPSLVARELSLAELTLVLKSGKGVMPPQPELDATDVERLHRFLAEKRAASQ
jgi:mono/diheme cytochrome c family protein